jgi:drug/metabolite transporter (DMT)-like permease
VLYLILPLASAILYPVGNLFLKRSIHEGGGLIRSLFVSNLVLLPCFLPLLAFAGEPPDWGEWRWPLLTGVCFFLGQLFTLVAIQSGDVSVQTPLMGLKLLFVAAFSSLIRPDEVPPLLWVGAAICTVGIFLIGGGSVAAFRRSARTVILTLIACLFFGATDTLSSYRSASFGSIPFVLATVGCVALLSLGLIPFFRGRLRDIPRESLVLMGIGSLAIGIQAVLLLLALTSFGQATSINIVYSCRALFGVLLVLFFGAKLGNAEASSAGSKVMRSRLAGALLLCAAVALVFLES